MEKNHLVTLVITIFVGIVLVGAVLVPIIDDGTKDYKVTNGFGNLVKLDEQKADTINCEVDDTGIEVNGSKWTRGDVTYNWTCPIVADSFVVKTLLTGSATSISFACIISGTSTVISSGISALTVEATGGSATVTVDYTDSSTPDATLTVPYNWIAYFDNNGDHVVQTLPWTGTFNYRAYYNDLSDLRGADFKTGTFYSYVGDKVTYGTTEYTATATTASVDDVVDVSYMDNNGANFTFNSIYIGVIVAPLTVYGTTEMMNDYVPLFGAMVVILIVSILLVAVGYIAWRREY